jgi:hypothetical protein
MLSEAAKTGNIWYVVAINNDNPEGPEARRGPVNAQPDAHTPTASATVFANIEGRCVSIQEYRSIPLDTLSKDLRAVLGEKEKQPTQASDPTGAPPS